MNVLELLQAYLRRASAGSGSPQIFLPEEETLPPRDPQVLAPGQEIGGLAAARGMGGGLHSNALGIYFGEPRPPPPGDVVLPSSDRGRLSVPYLPRASGEEAGRAGNVMTTPSYLPGPDGSTRIGWRPPPGMPLPQRTVMGTEGEPLDPAVLDMIGRGPRRQLPPGLPLGVQDSILNQPSYGEGERYPAREIGGEYNLPDNDPRNREYRLNDMIDSAEYMRRNSQHAWPENALPTPLQPGQSPYATRLPSALNQLLRRLPYGQY